MVHRQESVAIEAANRGGGPDGGYTLSESIRMDASASDMDKRKANSGVVDMDAKKSKRRSEPYAYKSIRNGTDEYKWWIEEAIDDGTVDILRGGKPSGRKRFVLPANSSLNYGSGSSPMETTRG